MAVNPAEKTKDCVPSITKPNLTFEIERTK